MEPNRAHISFVDGCVILEFVDGERPQTREEMWAQLQDAWRDYWEEYDWRSEQLVRRRGSILRELSPSDIGSNGWDTGG